jgi:hypothetical protein
MSRFAFPLILLVACATDAADDGAFISTDIPEDTGDGKADGPEIPFVVVDNLSVRSSIGKTEEGRVIRSASAFHTAFGGTAPAGLDFDDEWLAVYSGGVQTTGGYTAAISSLHLSDTGKSIKVISKLTRPGADCIVTQALSKPVAIVRFPAQHSAHTSRFTKLSETRTCTPTICGSDLTALLTTTTAGMFFLSESDRPLEVVSFGMQGAPSLATLLALTNTPAGTVAEERSFADTFDHLTTVFDTEDPASAEYAQRYQMLRQVMEANLSSLTVIRIGEIAIDVYFVGVSSCGELVAIKTVSIET